MEFSDFYNGLDNKQKKKFNKYMKGQINDNKRELNIYKVFPWIVVCILLWKL